MRSTTRSGRSISAMWLAPSNSTTVTRGQAPQRPLEPGSGRHVERDVGAVAVPDDDVAAELPRELGGEARVAFDPGVHPVFQASVGECYDRHNPPRRSDERVDS